MSELDKVKQKTVTLKIAGKDRILKMGMAAMGRIEEEYGDVAGMISALNKKPGTTMPIVILALMNPKENSDLTKENIAEMLDEAYEFEELIAIINELGPASYPDPKKETGNPPAAE